MTSTSIFFDTEFTAFENPQLISLGAVSERGDEFYGEVSPVPITACSEFTRVHVLPLLTGPGYPPPTLARLFTAWLAEQKGDIILRADSNHDLALVTKLCGSFPIFLPDAARCYWLPLPSSAPTSVHHALEDARALRLAHAPGWMLE